MSDRIGNLLGDIVRRNARTAITRTPRTGSGTIPQPPVLSPIANIGRNAGATARQAAVAPAASPFSPPPQLSLADAIGRSAGQTAFNPVAMPTASGSGSAVRMPSTSFSSIGQQAIRTARTGGQEWGVYDVDGTAVAMPAVLARRNNFNLTEGASIVTDPQGVENMRNNHISYLNMPEEVTSKIRMPDTFEDVQAGKNVAQQASALKREVADKALPEQASALTEFATAATQGAMKDASTIVSDEWQAEHEFALVMHRDNNTTHLIPRSELRSATDPDTGMFNLITNAVSREEAMAMADVEVLDPDTRIIRESGDVDSTIDTAKRSETAAGAIAKNRMLTLIANEQPVVEINGRHYPEGTTEPITLDTLGTGQERLSLDVLPDAPDGWMWVFDGGQNAWLVVEQRTEDGGAILPEGVFPVRGIDKNPAKEIVFSLSDPVADIGLKALDGIANILVRGGEIPLIGPYFNAILQAVAKPQQVNSDSITRLILFPDDTGAANQLSQPFRLAPPVIAYETWLRDNEDTARDIYENGYDPDESGNLIYGTEAVTQYWYDTDLVDRPGGSTTWLLFQVVTDPLTFVAGGGVAGRGLSRAGSRIRLNARTAAGVRTGQVMERGGQAINIGSRITEDIADLGARYALGGAGWLFRNSILGRITSSARQAAHSREVQAAMSEIGSSGGRNIGRLEVDRSTGEIVMVPDDANAPTTGPAARQADTTVTPVDPVELDARHAEAFGIEVGETVNIGRGARARRTETGWEVVTPEGETVGGTTRAAAESQAGNTTSSDGIPERYTRRPAEPGREPTYIDQMTDPLYRQMVEEVGVENMIESVRTHRASDSPNSDVPNIHHLNETDRMGWVIQEATQRIDPTYPARWQRNWNGGDTNYQLSEVFRRADADTALEYWSAMTGGGNTVPTIDGTPFRSSAPLMRLRTPNKNAGRGSRQVRMANNAVDNVYARLKYNPGDVYDPRFAEMIQKAIVTDHGLRERGLRYSGPDWSYDPIVSLIPDDAPIRMQPKHRADAEYEAPQMRMDEHGEFLMRVAMDDASGLGVDLYRITEDMVPEQWKNYWAEVDPESAGQQHWTMGDVNTGQGDTAFTVYGRHVDDVIAMAEETALARNMVDPETLAGGWDAERNGPFPRQAVDHVETIDPATTPQEATGSPQGDVVPEVDPLPAPEVAPPPALLQPDASPSSAVTTARTAPNVGAPPATAGTLISRSDLDSVGIKFPFNHIDLGDVTDKIYRETSIDNAGMYLPNGRDGNPDVRVYNEVFFSNDPELARGQGGNAGVLMEFDSAGIPGKVSKRKPTWELTWRRGGAEFTVPFGESVDAVRGNLRSIRIDQVPADNPYLRRTRRNMTLNGWEESVTDSGQTVWTRPDALPSSTAPTPQAGQIAQIRQLLDSLEGIEPEGTVPAESVTSIPTRTVAEVFEAEQSRATQRAEVGAQTSGNDPMPGAKMPEPTGETVMDPTGTIEMPVRRAADTEAAPEVTGTPAGQRVYDDVMDLPEGSARLNTIEARAGKPTPATHKQRLLERDYSSSVSDSDMRWLGGTLEKWQNDALTQYPFPDGETLKDRTTRYFIEEGNQRGWLGDRGEYMEATLNKVYKEYEAHLLENVFQRGVMSSKVKAGIKKLPEPAQKLLEVGAMLLRIPLRGFDRYSQWVRQRILFHPLKLLHYPMVQYVGNHMLNVLAGDWRVVRYMSNPANLVRATRRVKAGDTAGWVRDGGPMTTSQRMNARLGLESAPQTSDVLRGRAIGREGDNLIGGEILTRRLGRTGEAASFFVAGSKLARDWGAAMDVVYREAIEASSMHRFTKRVIPDYRNAQINRMVENWGIDMDDARALWKGFEDSTGNHWEFSPDDVYRHFSREFRDGNFMSPKDARGRAERMKRDWRQTLRDGQKYSQDQIRYRAMAQDQTRADLVAQRLMAFHFFQSRQMWFMVNQMANHPFLINLYINATEELERIAERNGYPEYLQGWLRILTGPGGRHLFLNPFALLATYGLFEENNTFRTDQDGESRNAFERWFKDYTGIDIDLKMFGVNPGLDNILNLAGVDGDTWAPDLTGYGRDANILTLVMNTGRMYGLWGDDPTPKGNWLEDTTRDLREWVSGINPWADQVDSRSSEQSMDREIRAIMADELAKEGIDPESDEGQLILAEAEMDPDSALYQKSLKRWVHGEWFEVGTRAVVGPFRPRFRLADRNDDDLMLNLGENTKKYINRPEPMVTVFNQQASAYHDLGDPRTSRLANIWNDVAYGEVDGSITVNGITYTEDEVHNMTSEQRVALANGLMAEHGVMGDINELRDERNKFLADPANRDYAQYRTWSGAVRDYPGGIEQYWQDLIKDNPTAKVYYDTWLSDIEGKSAREKAMTGHNAFFAINGWDTYVFDKPLETYSNRTEVWDPVGVANTQPQPIPYEEHDPAGYKSDVREIPVLTHNLQAYDSHVQRKMQQRGYPPGTSFKNLSRKERTAIEDELSSEGIYEPKPTKAQEDYLTWVAEQPPGSLDGLSEQEIIEMFLAHNQQEYYDRMPGQTDDKVNQPAPIPGPDQYGTTPSYDSGGTFWQDLFNLLNEHDHNTYNNPWP